MSGTRLQKKSTPVVNRLPTWSVENYYDVGHVICQKDSDDINIYVCSKSHHPNDSEFSFYVLDSETHLPRLNTNLWVHYLSTENLDSDERSPAALNRRIRNYQFTVDSDNFYLDSEILRLQSLVPFLPDSESVDSDLKIAKQDILFLSTETILKRFVDSDAKHKEIIVWDSDAQIYKTKPVMLTFNTFGPDNSGNIPLTITKVISGNKDNKPDSDVNGTVYVVVGDSDSDAAGNSFIFNNGTWDPIISPDRQVNDSKFLRVGGQNSMVGKLYVGTPITSNQIVNKAYVDASVKDSKQSAFGFFDSDAVIDVSGSDSENFMVSKEFPTLWFYDEINTTIIGKSEPYLVSFKNASVVSANVLQVQTNYFSNRVGGTLELYKDGSLEPFVSDSDDNLAVVSVGGGVAVDAKLVNSLNQTFTMNLTIAYSVASEYIIKYTMHDGDIATLTKDAGSSTWYPNPENFDFGTY